MNVGPRTVVKVITGTERLASSRNGNPRYRVTFDDGTDARTAVDSSVAYGITNSDVRRVPVFVTFDGRGHVIDVEPVPTGTTETGEKES